MDIVLRIIATSRDFSPYQLGEMIHLNLVVKKITFIFEHFFFFVPFSIVHAFQLTLSPIHNHKTKYENIFFKNGYGTHYT
jgi:hypothetical protein